MDQSIESIVIDAIRLFLCPFYLFGYLLLNLVWNTLPDFFGVPQGPWLLAYGILLCLTHAILS